MIGRLSVAAFAGWVVFANPGYTEPESFVYDIVVYGGTSSGVMAAVQASRMGKSVAIVSPDTHLGGLSSNGLGMTDTGKKHVIGGLAREFYQRVYTHYNQPTAWNWEDRAEYGNRGQGTPAIDTEARTSWTFEPHVAEQIFADFIKEQDIPVYRDKWLDRENGVVLHEGRIQSITTLDGSTYHALMFIDATYEGDLMAAAGVSYHVGREANSVYGEKWNGIQTGVLHHAHFFKSKISPYRIPDDPESGLLAGISSQPPGNFGEGDKRMQAYCFRMCLTDHPDNQIPFERPAGYDPDQYELLLRVFNTGRKDYFEKFDRIPNRKTDTNNHGPFSTDNIGMNYDYPDASYARRREIIREHEEYQKGLMYFIANDPRVPEDIQTEMRRWGLAADEFKDNRGWPYQLYVREARRMIGQYVITEHEVLGNRSVPNPIGMGSYTLDSHNVQRYITPEGYVQNEGDIGVKLNSPYQIPYGSIIPKEQECGNLLVPVCVSSSHIAYGSIRMEPVFMILGQSAATAASLAINQNSSVQAVDLRRLEELLLRDGQILKQLEEPDLRASKYLNGTN